MAVAETLLGVEGISWVKLWWGPQSDSGHRESSEMVPRLGRWAGKEGGGGGAGPESPPLPPASLLHPPLTFPAWFPISCLPFSHPISRMLQLLPESPSHPLLLHSHPCSAPCKLCDVLCAAGALSQGGF